MSNMRKPFRWSYLFITIAVIVVGYLANACQRSHEAEVAESYTVGLVTWIGYSPIYVARDKHFFADEKINVEVKTLDGPGAREAAYQADQLDFFPNTPDAFAIFFSERPQKGKMIAGLDESQGADGIVAKTGIDSIADLKGKRVGFQSGITSHFLLLELLKKYGLTGRDITQVDLSAGDAGQAFIAGKLDAAVTWEPWLTQAQKTPDAHVLATSKDTPGLIVDVLLVSDKALKNEGGPAKAFMRAWYKGLAFIRSNPQESETIIAKALNVSTAEVKKMLTTTHFNSPEESERYLRSNLPVVMHDANELFFDNNVIRTRADLSGMIDPLISRTAQ